MEIHITKSASETAKLGEKLAKRVTNGGILALYGDLGSGKTTFVQGLAKGLGITKRIISPTFVIIRQYYNFYHIDLYRVENQHGLEGLGIEEIFNNPKNIVAIEWAEKLSDMLPKGRLDVRFEHMDEGERKITWSNK